MILQIETATDICSVGLSQSGKILSLCETDEKNVHAAQLTRLIEKCLSEAGAAMKDLAAIAVSIGPGSYTGLRVGLSTAKGLAYALDLPLIAVNTLQSLAFACREAMARTDVLYCPMIDARRMEVYTALYDPDFNIIEPIQAKVLDAASYDPWFNAGKTIVFCGNGAEKCTTLFRSPLAIFSPVRCSASHLTGLSALAFLVKDFADLALVSPEYVKPPNITVSRQKI